MKMFVKKFYGFGPEILPVITFSQVDSRDSLLRKAQPEDLMLYVAVMDDRAKQHERGMLLGMAQIGRVPVRTMDIVKDKNILPDNYFDQNGNILWPEAIPMIRAWRFDPAIEKSQIFKHTNVDSQATRIHAIPVHDDDIQEILNLKNVEISLPKNALLENITSVTDSFGLAKTGKPTKGPVPYEGNFSGTRGGNKDVYYTYAFRYGETQVWKIGHCADLSKRLQEINQHIPIEIEREIWGNGMSQPWPSAQLAYKMEQFLFDEVLKQKRTQGERVRCSRQDIDSAWAKAIVKIRDANN